MRVLENIRDGRTTLPTVIGIIFTLIGSIFPQWFTDVPVEELTAASLNIMNGVGIVIVWITGLLSRGGTRD